jgi:hypothetical protein
MSLAKALRTRTLRMVLALSVLVGGLVWVWRTNLKPERVSLVITAVIGAVTTVYALLTFEMLLQNQRMAKAASDSSQLMERSLRFTHIPNLLFSTVNTKDPTFGLEAIAPVENDDYRRALDEFKAGGKVAEFVFAVVTNRGHGAATNLNLEAVYNITDGSSPNRDSTVSKHASIPILEPQTGVALCIFISKVPTPDDKVVFSRAKLKSGDFYRDYLREPPREIDIDRRAHHTKQEPDSVVQLA